MKQIDTEAAALMLHMTPNHFRVYAHRHKDLLPRRGRDSKGRTLYAYDDVERVLENRFAKAA